MTTTRRSLRATAAQTSDPVVPAVDSLDRIALALVAATNTAIMGGALGIEPTFVQWRALVVLDPSRSHLRLFELAARIGISRPSASRLVGRLEHRGLVVSSPDDRDGRGVRIQLTDLGRQVRESVIARRHEAIAMALAGADLSPELERGLQQLAELLTARLG